MKSLMGQFVSFPDGSFGRVVQEQTGHARVRVQGRPGVQCVNVGWDRFTNKGAGTQDDPHQTKE